MKRNPPELRRVTIKLDTASGMPPVVRLTKKQLIELGHDSDPKWTKQHG